MANLKKNPNLVYIIKHILALKVKNLIIHRNIIAPERFQAVKRPINFAFKPEQHWPSLQALVTLELVIQITHLVKRRSQVYPTPTVKILGFSSSATICLEIKA